jgi:dihydroxyacetone kinase DhaKLM complex PTS-EIIA-like component DhaM
MPQPPATSVTFDASSGEAEDEIGSACAALKIAMEQTALASVKTNFFDMMSSFLRDGVETAQMTPERRVVNKRDVAIIDCYGTAAPDNEQRAPQSARTLTGHRQPTTGAIMRLPRRVSS